MITLGHLSHLLRLAIEVTTKEKKEKKSKLSLASKRIDKDQSMLIKSEHAFHELNSKSDDVSIAIKEIRT